MKIRPLLPQERDAWLELRTLLWPETSRNELAQEQDEILSDQSRGAVLVAAHEDGSLAGFVEVSLRDWAEGCTTRPVGYIEGWYVRPAHRLQGLGKRLLAAAERWAWDRGCSEMGSDADLENQVSQSAHAACGYVEEGRIVLFSKKIVP